MTFFSEFIISQKDHNFSIVYITRPTMVNFDNQITYQIHRLKDYKKFPHLLHLKNYTVILNKENS